MTKIEIFNLLKASEGGVSQAAMIALLAANGIKAWKAHSIYVGHYALAVAAKHAKKASKLLYGF